MLCLPGNRFPRCYDNKRAENFLIADIQRTPGNPPQNLPQDYPVGLTESAQAEAAYFSIGSILALH